MKKLIRIFSILIILMPSFVVAESIDKRLSGKILLQVEDNGEAWYINPSNLYRYYLGRPEDAFDIMRKQGVGISNENIKKIPVNIDLMSGSDSDNDGLSDDFEKAIGTNPNNSDSDGDGHDDKSELVNSYDPSNGGPLGIDYNFSNSQKGKIFLQVESKGEAWYVNPSNGERYYLGRPKDAFEIMRFLGLGISNSDLAKIKEANSDSYIDINSEDQEALISQIEEEIHYLVNVQRKNYELSSLRANSNLSSVAREHSNDLALENQDLTNPSASCDFPLIHHEGFEFGIYHSDRLNNRGIYYFSKSAENIALVPRVSYSVEFSSQAEANQINESCSQKRQVFQDDFQKITDTDDVSTKLELLEKEINSRAEAYKKEEVLKVSEESWYSVSSISKTIVDGWMNSPGHRANILTADYNEVGTGVSFVNGYVIATQVFIKRIDCGYKNGPCCMKDGYYPYCYSPLSCGDNICQ